MKKTKHPYNEEYYLTCCGPVPYVRDQPHWESFFSQISDWIIKEIHPKTVLDVGCAKGFLVEALRDRGVDAFGLDISEYALSQIREDIKPFCWLKPATEPLAQDYDLITCIEVLEHLNEKDGSIAIRNICSRTDCIIFSSSPVDFEEKTHINVRPPIYWLRLFAENCFYPDLNLDAGFIAPQAMALRKNIPGIGRDVLSFYAKMIDTKFHILELHQKIEESEKKVKEQSNVISIQLETLQKKYADLVSDFHSAEKEKKEYFDKFRMMTDAFNIISHSFSYLAGCLLTYPIRIIYRLCRSTPALPLLFPLLEYPAGQTTREPIWGNRVKRVRKFICHFMDISRQYFRSPQLMKLNIGKFIGYLRRGNFRGILSIAFQKAVGRAFGKDTIYETWIRNNEPHKDELERQTKVRFKYSPVISIITPVFNTQAKMLIEMLESVKAQTYKNWELCIADGGSTDGRIRDILALYSRKDKRIKVRFLRANKGIALNSNEAIKLAAGDFMALLDHDDILAPFALFEVVKAINKNPEAECFYSDEDKISEDGKNRFCAFLKPDFSPDTLRSCNYITHLFVLRKDIGRSVAWFREGFDGSQDYDLILRVTEKSSKVVHIPRILYHWRVHSASASFSTSAKPYAYEMAAKAIREHLKRIGLKNGQVEMHTLLRGYYKTTYEIAGRPLVSVIIINGKNAVKCIQSILQKSTYPNYEIILAVDPQEKDNLESIRRKHKDVRIVEPDRTCHVPYANNLAAKSANGDILLFLDSSSEIVNADCIERMLEHAMRNNVGAVGGKFYNSHSAAQHNGFVFNIAHVSNYWHAYFPSDGSAYFTRMHGVQNLNAVSAACFMMRRALFVENGGFDENFKTIWFDIDMCLRLQKSGYLIVWTPYAEIYSAGQKLKNDLYNYREDDSDTALFHSKWKGSVKTADCVLDLCPLDAGI